jgi:prevent-host-death family protein
MPERRRRRNASRTSATSPASGRIAAGVFKARCLDLMDRVRETGAEYVITKHGRPVAKLVPVVDTSRQSLFGSMKGTVLAYERPFDPIDGDYDINRS